MTIDRVRLRSQMLAACETISTGSTPRRECARHPGYFIKPSKMRDRPNGTTGCWLCGNPPEKQRLYRKTEKGRRVLNRAQKHYKASEKGRRTQERYENSEKGRRAIGMRSIRQGAHRRAEREIAARRADPTAFVPTHTDLGVVNF